MGEPTPISRQFQHLAADRLGPLLSPVRPNRHIGSSRFVS